MPRQEEQVAGRGSHTAVLTIREVVARVDAILLCRVEGRGGERMMG